MTEPGALFLDTSVLMYAAGGEHPLRRPCLDALERVLEEGIDLVTSSEVLQEILYRYFSIGRADTARTVFDSARNLSREVLPVTEADTVRALHLLLEGAKMSPRDAIHVAVMESNELPRILSTDRHFDRIDSVERVDPAELAGRSTT